MTLVPQNGRKADWVSEDLLRQIVSGQLEPGDLLPKETELASSYGVNKSVVREAIKLLEVHRLVRPIKRRGTEVLDASASLSPEVLIAMLAPSPGQVDRATLADFLEIRAQIDGHMCALAAERRTESDIERLGAVLAEMRDYRGPTEGYSDVLNRLVLTIADASQNRIFAMLVHWHLRVQDSLDDLMLLVRQPTPAHIQGLAYLVDLIIKGDAEGARKAIHTFHQWATPRLLAAAALRSGTPLEQITQ